MTQLRPETFEEVADAMLVAFARACDEVRKEQGVPQLTMPETIYLLRGIMMHALKETYEEGLRRGVETGHALEPVLLKLEATHANGH